MVSVIRRLSGEVVRDSEHINSYYAASAIGVRQYPRIKDSESCDVCVVGGGYTGTSTALELAEKGYEVVLLEANRVGWGASGRNGGQVGTGMNHTQAELEKEYGLSHARQMWDICEEAKRLVRERVSKYAIPCYYKPGVLGAALTQKANDEYRAEVEHMIANYNCETLRYVDAAEIVDMVGERGYLGGKFDSSAGHIHPLNYAIGLAKAANDAGVRIYEKSAVDRYVTNNDGIQSQTRHGVVKSKLLVLACNAYIDGISRRLQKIIMPVYSYIIATEPLDADLAEQVNRADVAVFDSRFSLDYYRLSHDRRMLYGARESYIAEMHRNKIARRVGSRMYKMYPELKQAKIEYGWGGRIAVTVNRLPAIGRLHSAVYYAQGFSGHGVALTGMAGRVIAEAIAGTEEQFDVFKNIKHLPFPGGRILHWPLYLLGMSYYTLRDRIG